MEQLRLSRREEGDLHDKLRDARRRKTDLISELNEAKRSQSTPFGGEPQDSGYGTADSTVDLKAQIKRLKAELVDKKQKSETYKEHVRTTLEERDKLRETVRGLEAQIVDLGKITN